MDRNGDLLIADLLALAAYAVLHPDHESADGEDCDAEDTEKNGEQHSACAGINIQSFYAIDQRLASPQNT